MPKTTDPNRQQKRDRGNRNSRGPREPKEFEETTLSIDRVTRVVKGGRRMRFRAVVVIGNRKGKVGLGTGKANEVQAAVQKAVKEAKRNLIRVPLVKGTIPHEVDVKFKAAKLRLIPASDGTGIIAGGSLRVIFDHAGVKNVLSKRFGTGNKLVNAQATMEALKQLSTYASAESLEKEEEAEVKKNEAKDNTNATVRTVSKDQVVGGNLAEKKKTDDKPKKKEEKKD